MFIKILLLLLIVAPSIYYNQVVKDATRTQYTVTNAAAEYGEGDGARRQQIGAYDEIPEIEEGASLRKGLEAGKRRKAQRGRK